MTARAASLCQEQQVTAHFGNPGGLKLSRFELQVGEPLEDLTRV